ncbi:MAG TPA: M14 family zinc carboxypeptidase, partial [Nocardioidaceae bacterium]|nr:M14 family zinc carboxypeptidase [Nocardioidaceae bacterium]
THWGYDNEGSSPDFDSETYRGPRPASEPETWAFRRLARRVGFQFMVNYHSAAELILYGTGWQVATPTPDDVIYETMAGDDAKPAIPGYDPDISAELYTTNGETDGDVQAKFGTLAFTPEMSTCDAASAVDPDDEWLPEDCGSGFEFPDDEALIQAEFLKNVPFALSVARSAADPDDPASVVGRKTTPFRVDAFDVSTGNPQTVAAVAKRALTKVQLRYRINGGPTKIAPAPLWAGGERYGDENNDYYAERRGVVKGTKAGDEVEVWFSGHNGLRRVASRHFTYSVESNTGADVLVIANEDYTGVNPTYPPEVTGPQYADLYVDALSAAGQTADVWDVDAQGVPHDLGVLSHYDAVVWYLGDNRLTQDPEDEAIDTPFGELPDIGVAERQQYLTIAVRDYLNEGGKLVHMGETAQYEGLTGISDAVGGLYYGLNGDPTAECHVDSVGGFFSDCLIMANDFRQYWLGAFGRIDLAGPPFVEGIGTQSGFNGTFGGPVVTGSNPVDEAGLLTPTSDVLPVDEFPQFASQATALYSLGESSPYNPIEGTRYAGVLHQDGTYARLTKTVDLTAATAAELQFSVSFDTEPSYDNVIVEARTVGQEDWTTLPEAGGATGTTVPAECSDPGFLLELHPFLRHYLSGAVCTPTGTTGDWNAMTGNSAGWQQVAFDLAAYAGSQVEVSISYVSDPGSGGVGMFVDDTHVVVDAVDDADGFEGGTSSWTPSAPPAGSPTDAAQWQISEALIELVAGTSTSDTYLFGFGLEQLDDAGDRADLIGNAFEDFFG